MFSDENTITITGRIISQVVVRPTKSGGKMVTFSLANNYTEEDEGGNARTDTSYINVVAWGEEAKLLAAGRPAIARRDYVRVTGRLSINAVERPDGTKVSYTQIIVREVQPLDRANDKRYSGSGVAGGKAFKHYSQTTTYDRYIEGGLGSEGGEESLYNPEADGTEAPSLADIARQTRREDEEVAQLKRQVIPSHQPSRPISTQPTNFHYISLATSTGKQPQPQPHQQQPQKTSLVNLRAHVPYDVRIDRASKWGNPFRESVDGSREEVIEKYREWIKGQPHLMRSLPELRGKTLACWCSPLPCHGDVLLELLEEYEG